MNHHQNRLRLVCMALVAASAIVLVSPAIAQTPGIVGLNFSDGRSFTKMAGKTADGCTNWFDTYTGDNNGYKDGNYPGLAYGTATFASGIITAQWVSSTTFSGGASDNSQQQLYYTYLDDGDANPVMSDGIGVNVTLSGLGSWLATNQATRYQIRLYGATTWNLGQMTTNAVASIRLGAPNPANGSTQLTALTVLETFQVQWRGDGGYPTATSGSGARGYGDSSTNLSSDTITITIPSKDAMSSASRGSLAAIKLIPINSSSAPPAPLPAYGQAVTNNGPLAYWRLNELSGATIAADFFGNYNGSVGSNVTAGVSGPQSPQFIGFETNNLAMVLNGTTNSYLTMPTFNLNTNTVTITGWINPTGTQSNSAGIVFCRGGTTAAGLNFSSGGGNELRYTWNGLRSDISTGLIVPTNQWSFFGLVVTPTSATLYFGTNGTLNSFTDSVSLPIQAFDAPLRVGFDPGAGSRLFNGKVDEVALYKRALTQAQMQLLYITAAGCPGDPSITSPPTNQTVTSGTTATFSVTGTGPTVLGYQWQVSTNGGADFNNITGATNASYTTPATTLANSGNQYRAAVSGLCGTPVTSAAATLTVVPPPLPGYGQAMTNSAPLAYWRLNETNGSTVAADFYGVNNGTIGSTVTAGVNGPQNPPFAGFEANNAAMQLNYSATSILTMPTFNLNTNTVTITGWINPTGFQADSAGLVFCRGGASNTVAGLNFQPGGGNELHYTWNNDRFAVTTGLVAPTNQWSFFALVVTPTGATLYLGTNGVLNSYTDSVSLPVQAFGAPLLIGSDPASGGRLYRGVIDEVALFNRALTPTQIQQLYSGGAGCPGGPSITNQPANQTVVNGLAATFSVAATGPTTLNYQWQISTNGGGSFANLAGANNSSYTTPPTTVANNGTQYRTLVSGLCGAAVTSTVATLSVEWGGYPQVATNLVPFAYWRLNEPNGSTTAADFYGVYNGAIGSTVTAGVSGPRSPSFLGFETGNTAMQLNYATTSILTMPALNLNTNTVTITGWINPTGIQADAAGLVFCRGGTTVAGLDFQSGGGNELRYTWNGVRFDVSTGLVVPTNQWSFFALVVTPGGAKLYLGTNGVLNSFTDSVALPNQAFDASLLIGSDPAGGGRLFNGKVDEIAVYNRSLTPAQIQLLYVTAAGCPGNPSITTPPASQTVPTGATATFSVAAAGPTALSYQWQVSTNAGGSFANVTGATNTSYTTPSLALSDNGTQYRAVVSGLCGTPATSTAATLSVIALTVSGYGQEVTNHSPVAYWRLNEPNGSAIAYDLFGAHNGAIGSNVTGGVSGPRYPQFPGFETNNTAMQCNYAAGSYLTMPVLNLNTNTVTITGWVNPTGAQADGAGLVFCRGGSTVAGLNFSAGGTNELRYTWGTHIGGSTGLIVATNQWSFFALVVAPTGATLYLGTNGALNSFTDTFSLSSQAFDASLLIGYDSAVTGRLFNGRVDEVAIYGHVLSQTDIYQLYISGGGCPGNPSITSQPTNQTIISGSTASFSIRATGPTPLSYQWQISTNAGASFGDISGAASTNYTTPVLTLANTNNQYRAVVGGLCGTVATSSVASVTVNPPPPLTVYAQMVTNSNPFAYWRLNETNGAAVAHDFFGVYNGTIGPNVTAGVSGPQSPQFSGFEGNNTAMQFDSSSGTGLMMPTLNLNTNTVTITGWINPSGPQIDWAGIVFCRGGSTVAGLNFPSGGSTELRYTWDGYFGGSTGLIVPTNQWSFFALVMTPSGATLYMGTNGVLNSFTDSTSLPGQAFDSPLLIGYDSINNRRFNGRLDEVAIYNRALTSQQIQQFYITGAGCPGGPSITNQPANQTVPSGSGASFSVGATGPTVLSYQWQISTNGGADFSSLNGVTNTSYATPTLTLNDNGNQYRVLVSGLCGPVATSTVATVTVNPPPPLTGYAQLVTNSAPVAYWRLNETNGATVAADFFGVYNGSIGAGVTGGVSGPRNPPFAGFEANNTAMQLNYTGNSYLTMPTLNLNTNTVTIMGWMNPTGIQADWTGVVFCRGISTTAGLNFPAGGLNELRYTWNGNRYDVSTGLVVPTNQWSFFALVVTPSGATLYVGTNGVLNSFTDSTSLPVQGFEAPLQIGYDSSSGSRMFRGGIDEVAIYNRALTTQQIQQFYITGAGCPGNPSITTQPADQTVSTGSTATFSVAATGPTLLSYLWQVSTNAGASFAALSGATNASYTTPALTMGNSGTQYRAFVSGLCGTAATSTVATLTVNPPPALAGFVQAITNTAPFAYWRLNETNGATVAHDYYGVFDGTIGSGVTLGISGPQNPPFSGFESNNPAMLLGNTATSYLTMPTFNVNMNTVTIIGWINPTGVQADWAGIVFCRGGGTVAGLSFDSGGVNELRYIWNGARFDVNTGLIVPTNQWSFFGLVVTPTNATVYLGTNGILNSFRDTTSLPSQTFAGPLLLGYDSASGTRLFKGGLDEVAFYEYALTTAQLQQLYIAGAGCSGGASITTPPANQTVFSGSTAIFTVAATGPTSLNYQWQISTNSGASFADVTGANAASYTTPVVTSANSGTQYRVIVNGLCGSAATSTVATLSVEVSNFAQTVAGDTPLAYWRLNETNGATVAVDSVGGHNGSIGAGVSAGVSGPQNPPLAGFESINTAMEFNGAGNSYLTMPTFSLNTNTVTITGWIKPAGIQLDWAAIVFCRSAATAAGLNFNDATTAGYNELRYTWNGSRYDTHTGLVMPVNQWSFFGLVVTPTNATVYLGTNGVLNSYTDPVPPAVQPFDAALLMGHDAFYGRGFNGGIDEVAIYSGALSPTQLQDLYTSAGYEAPPLTPFQTWQLRYFGCTGCAQADAAADPDGDGLSNGQEYQAGTDPTNSVSALRITAVERINSDIRVTWTTVESHGYVLQTNASPSSSGFTDFGPSIFVPAGTGESSTNYLDLGGGTVAPARYYRVRLAP